MDILKVASDNSLAGQDKGTGVYAGHLLLIAQLAKAEDI
jgi:hypothetical protein